MELDFVLTGSRIRALRTERRMSLNILARRIGLSPAFLRHVEAGHSKPSLTALFHIADVLETSLDYLTGRTSTVSDSWTSPGNLSYAQQAAIQGVLASIVPVITDQN